MTKAVVWTMAGSDSGGGAGIQADLHVMQGMGVHGCSVITAVTAQNTHAVKEIHWVPAAHVAAQIQALREDLAPQAIKLGMLGDVAAVAVISDFLKQYSGKVVLDPVMIAGCGDHLFADDVADRIALLQHIFPVVDVITPNLQEAARLVGFALTSHQAIAQAATQLLAMGSKSVLIKGGHVADEQWSQDYWTNGTEAFWLASPRIASAGFHGAGCTLSSAIASALGLGYGLKEALVIGKMVVNRGLRLAAKQGAGLMPVAHGGWPEAAEDFPQVAVHPLQDTAVHFPSCDRNLGLYPLVDRSAWLETLLPLGVKTIQLRIKDLTESELAAEIKRAVFLSKQFLGVRLFINDHWELAIKYGAYGVHLGQTDLSAEAITKIRQAGLRLGVSTHNYYELAIAQALHPSYIAVGPIFATSSKQFSDAPLGIETLQRWRKLVRWPLVAIGGIGREQVPELLAAGADGVAVIAAIVKTENPNLATEELLGQVQKVAVGSN